MDEQAKNERQTRTRDEALARRMGDALDRIAATGTGECPDPGLLAAYYERALQPDEMEQWEGHFAGCARCRRILAVLSASIDAPMAEAEVARLGELVAGAQHPASTPVSVPGKVIKSARFDCRARWLAPAVGIAAVLIVWFAVRPPWRTPGQSASDNLIAQAPKSEPAPIEMQGNIRRLDQPSGEESKKVPAPSAVIVEGHSSQNFAPARPASDLPINGRETDKSLDQLKAKDATTENLSKKEEADQGGAAKAVSGALQPAAPAPPSVAAPQASAPEPYAQAMSDSPARDKQAAGAALGARSEVAPQAAAEVARDANKTQALSVIVNATSAAFTQAQSPSGKILWRASGGGKIERSTDAGRTWSTQDSPTTQDWLAAAAFSDTVCWLAGRNGVIARTTDGIHWTLIASPVAAATPDRFPDWTAITATSELAATITSSDNRRYTTADGGRTWRQQ